MIFFSNSNHPSLSPSPSIPTRVSGTSPTPTTKRPIASDPARSTRTPMSIRTPKKWSTTRTCSSNSDNSRHRRLTSSNRLPRPTHSDQIVPPSWHSKRQGKVINYSSIILFDWQSLAINHNPITITDLFVPIQSYSNHNHFKAKTEYRKTCIFATGRQKIKSKILSCL